jgi:hypothetical protein
MNKITRSEKFNSMTRMEKDLASIESLNELVLLYNAQIQRKLDEITLDPILQSQVKSELGIK